MTAVFEKHGLNFQYPENWKLQENYSPDVALELYLLAPDDAFWSLLAYPAQTSARQLMQDVLDSLNQQYEGFESEPVSEFVAQTRLEGFDSNFFCMDLLVTSKMRSVVVDQHHLLIMSQAESREFEKHEPVFRAITTSLLTGLQEAPRWQPNSDGR